MHRLADIGLVRVEASWTDRLQRVGEENIEHVFVSSKEFEKRKAKDFFLEVVQPFGLEYGYGVPRLKFEKQKVTLVMLRYQFLDLAVKHYPGFVTYHIEAPYDMVKKELLKRSDNQLGSRLKDYEEECEQGRLLADRTFVNSSTLEALFGDVVSAINTDFGAEPSNT